MRQSNLFTKTIRESPKDEKSINAKLLIRAGFFDKLMAGVYSYLPLGFLVFSKIKNIIREEMNRVSGQEVFLPTLHPRKIWETTDRWHDKEGIMFKLKSRSGKDYGLGWTHEEVITPLVKKFVQSYKDLPVSVYQIQNKFRDELRAKSGLLRGVEFVMKDMYSFHASEEDLNKYYEKVKGAYFRIFQRCGIGKKTFLALALGGAFSKYSHEFQTITPYGEDTIYLCQKCKLGLNKEIIEDQKYKCPQCKNKELEIKKTIEVGNIFDLKTRFSKAFDFTFKDKDGKDKPIMMGCYGLGLGRLLGTIVEVHNDERGIIWPKEVAPFLIHLIALENEIKVSKASEELYRKLQGTEVLYDDREDKTAGEKFADSDLIGIPIRVVVSKKTLGKNSVEVKKRGEKKEQLVEIANLNKFLKSFI
ncbi:MAG: His/Gly/Thr/Pro-type tRNA ligase C-terminal domain-containing protein [Patescibacteria group bacterium]|nr:His/Gly/Thr/Pro-type tRNA ligase C-terminal domain-containing protein [Patescibacteria group bacterium]